MSVNVSALQVRAPGFLDTLVGGARPVGRAGGVARTGDHGDGAARRRRAGLRRPGRAARARPAHRHRRLRHRLLLAGLPPAARHRRPEDRPVLHQRDRERRAARPRSSERSCTSPRRSTSGSSPRAWRPPRSATPCSRPAAAWARDTSSRSRSPADEIVPWLLAAARRYRHTPFPQCAGGVAHAAAAPRSRPAPRPTMRQGRSMTANRRPDHAYPSLAHLRDDPRLAMLSQLQRSNPMLDAVIDEVRGRRIRVGEHWLADFASCNYLGFDLDPEIAASIDEQVRPLGHAPELVAPARQPAALPGDRGAADRAPGRPRHARASDHHPHPRLGAARARRRRHAPAGGAGAPDPLRRRDGRRRGRRDGPPLPARRPRPAGRPLREAPVAGAAGRRASTG